MLLGCCSSLVAKTLLPRHCCQDIRQSSELRASRMTRLSIRPETAKISVLNSACEAASPAWIKKLSSDASNLRVTVRTLVLATVLRYLGMPGEESEKLLLWMMMMMMIMLLLLCCTPWACFLRKIHGLIICLFMLLVYRLSEHWVSKGSSRKQLHFFGIIAMVYLHNLFLFVRERWCPSVYLNRVLFLKLASYSNSYLPDSIRNLRIIAI